MTTQEPDKKCITKMECMSFYNKEKCKDYQQIEVVDLCNADISLENNILKIDDDCILFENNLGFEFDGEYILVKVSNSLIKEVILANGTYVKYKNKEIIKERLKGCYVGDVNEVFER